MYILEIIPDMYIKTTETSQNSCKLSVYERLEMQDCNTFGPVCFNQAPTPPCRVAGTLKGGSWGTTSSSIYRSSAHPDHRVHKTPTCPCLQPMINNLKYVNRIINMLVPVILHWQLAQKPWQLSGRQFHESQHSLERLLCAQSHLHQSVQREPEKANEILM